MATNDRLVTMNMKLVECLVANTKVRFAKRDVLEVRAELHTIYQL